MPDDARALLRLLAEGRSTADILATCPGVTAADIASAAAQGLASLQSGPRMETRDERVRRLRLLHPRAYEPWGEDEDARLLRRFEEGARAGEIAREMGRPPNAVRARLERWLGPSWRSRGIEPAHAKARPPPGLQDG